MHALTMSSGARLASRHMQSELKGKERREREKMKRKGIEGRSQVSLSLSSHRVLPLVDPGCGTRRENGQTD